MRRKSRQPVTSDPGRAPIFHYHSAPERTVAEGGGRADRGVSKNTKSWAKSLPGILAALIVVFALVANLYVSSVPNFKIGDKPDGLQNEQVYKDGISKILNASILNRSKVTLNVSQVEEDILNKFPEISNVVISLPFVGQQPAIGVEFSQPAFLVTAKNGKFVVGYDGRVLVKGATSDTLPSLEDASGIEYELGKRIMTPEDVELLLAIESEMKAQGREVSNLVIGKSPRDIDVALAGASYKIKFSFMHDIREQLGAATVILEQIAGNSVVSPAEYIDARLADRVFLK